VSQRPGAPRPRYRADRRPSANRAAALSPRRATGTDLVAAASPITGVETYTDSDRSTT
jgi:hypothetical protein